MELHPTPHRGVATRFWLIVAALILAPLTLLVFLPSALGLQRYVVSDSALHGTAGRGSLVFASRVPVTSLAVGDVISFPSASSGGLVTRRVSSVDLDGVHTSDAAGRVDPWSLSLSTDVDRAVLGIPWLGYPFLGVVDRGMWLLIAAVPFAAVVLALAGDLDRARRARRRQQAITLSTAVVADPSERVSPDSPIAA
jgi:signal peptidase I